MTHYTLHQNLTGHYLIDLKDKEAMHLYYGVKERFDYRLDNRDDFIKDIANSLKPVIHQYDWIAIPESSSDFLSSVMKELGCPYHVVKKNNISNVLQFVETLPLQRKEKIAHIERLNSMGKVFKINLMKSNQRRKYDSVIFENNTNLQGKGLVIDDSLFSGTTLEGLKHALPSFDFIAIFAK